MAAHGKAFFDTKLAPKFEMGCEDPIETVLSAADEFGVKFFVSNDYWGPDLDCSSDDDQIGNWARKGINQWKKSIRNMGITRAFMGGISPMNRG